MRDIFRFLPIFLLLVLTSGCVKKPTEKGIRQDVAYRFMLEELRQTNDVFRNEAYSEFTIIDTVRNLNEITYLVSFKYYGVPYVAKISYERKERYFKENRFTLYHGTEKEPTEKNIGREVLHQFMLFQIKYTNSVFRYEEYSEFAITDTVRNLNETTYLVSFKYYNQPHVARISYERKERYFEASHFRWLPGIEHLF